MDPIFELLNSELFTIDSKSRFNNSKTVMAIKTENWTERFADVNRRLKARAMAELQGFFGMTASGKK